MRPFAAAEGACVTSATACGNQSSAEMLKPDDDICGAGRNSNDCQFDVCACGAANIIRLRAPNCSHPRPAMAAATRILAARAH